MNVAELLATDARRHGWTGRPAFHTETGTVTHGEVHDLAARVATVLAGRGVGAGTRVVVALPDGVGWVAVFLGLARLGAVGVLVNPALTPNEHDVLASAAGAVAAVAEEELAGRLGGWDVAALLAEADRARPAPAVPVPPTARLYVQYTSGTTGTPKGVPHRHGDILAYRDLVAEPVLRLRPEDVGLSVSKAHFAYGFGNGVVFPLATGSATVLRAQRPGPAEVAELLGRHGVTVLYSVPAGYTGLVAESPPRPGRALRAAVCAGEVLAEAAAHRIADHLGVPVLDQLGCTEAGHAFCANTVSANRPGTVGPVLPGFRVQLREAPAPDTELDPAAPARVLTEPEAEGELWVCGPTLFDGYLDRPAATAAVLVDGWYRTRDRVRRHADATLTPLGRVDDLELVGGITISPQEVEQVLARHAAVGEVAVAAVPDELGRSRLRAFVVPDGDPADPALLSGELERLARAHLAPFKVPRSVRLVTALPRTPSGKLRRSVVRRGRW